MVLSADWLNSLWHSGDCQYDKIMLAHLQYYVWRHSWKKHANTYKFYIAIKWQISVFRYTVLDLRFFLRSITCYDKVITLFMNLFSMLKKNHKPVSYWQIHLFVKASFGSSYSLLCSRVFNLCTSGFRLFVPLFLTHLFLHCMESQSDWAATL